MCKLYIIGNGFDLWHGLKTSYNDFKNWLIREHYREFKIIKKYNNQKIFHEKLNGNWSNIENALILEDQKIGTSITSSSITNNIITVFQKLFNTWIYDINENISKNTNVKTIDSLSSNDYYFTFNYTKLLETLYNIKAIQNNELKIIHIHGIVEDNKEDFTECHTGGSNQIVFGNKYNLNNKNTNPFLNDLSTRFCKDTNRFENYFESFIKNFKNISEIIVLGQSMDKINGDLEYFIKINKIFSNIPWGIGYYNNKELCYKKKIVNSIGIKNYKFIKFKS